VKKIIVTAIAVMALAAFVFGAEAGKDRKGAIKITGGSGTVNLTKEVLTPQPAVKQVRKLEVFEKEVLSKETILKVDIEEAEVLYNSGKALFVDARGAFEFDDSRIKGSVNVPSGDAVKRIEAQKELLKDKILVTYCSGAGCHLADKVAGALFDAGYRKIVIFFGGWPKWVSAQMPVEGKKTKDGKLQ